jgi:outer membrane lipoprotein carrier protein
MPRSQPVLRTSAALSVLSFALAVALSATSGAPRAAAQRCPATPPDAAQVAARVRSFYDQTRTVQASFRQHFWSKLYQRTQSSRGRLAIQRERHQIRFDYESPSGKVLVSDGSQWTLFEPTESGGQYARGDAAASSTGALGFLMGSESFDRYCLSMRAPQSTQPEHTDALVLRPRAPDPHFVRIVVYVDNRAEAAGVVRRVSIEDHDGNWNRFDFGDLRFNRDIDPGHFRYTPPAGARDMGASAPRATE